MRCHSTVDFYRFQKPQQRGSSSNKEEGLAAGNENTSGPSVQKGLWGGTEWQWRVLDSPGFSIPFSKVRLKHGHDTVDSVILQPHGVLIFLLAHPKRTWLKDLSNLHGMSYRASFRIVSWLSSFSHEAFSIITQSNPNIKLKCFPEVGLPGKPNSLFFFFLVFWLLVPLLLATLPLKDKHNAWLLF